MPKCKICNDETQNTFNMYFKLVPICETCAEAIFLQQAYFYATNQQSKRIMEIVNDDIEKYKHNKSHKN